MKITMDRTHGNNARQKSYQESVLKYPRRKKTLRKSKREVAGQWRKFSEENRCG
jgi:hypothetical protein